MCRELLKKGLGLWRGDDDTYPPDETFYSSPPGPESGRSVGGNHGGEGPEMPPLTENEENSKASLGAGDASGQENPEETESDAEMTEAASSGVVPEEGDSASSTPGKASAPNAHEAEPSSGLSSEGGLVDREAGIDAVVEVEEPYLDVGPEGLFPAPLDKRNKSLRTVVETRFR